MKKLHLQFEANLTMNFELHKESYDDIGFICCADNQKILGIGYIDKITNKILIDK